ncbi:MAG: insulinase family protein [Lachnospiraceae bacterium]|nr:insulinase family protein [Lachnospiraceae bacterium]
MSANLSRGAIRIPATYKLIKEEYVSDCKGTGYLLKHIKSGARVCLIKNNDINKSFCIAFRTPPKDDTGVAHIIEHTVLCGSRKYTAKDPFIELAKGSLSTFLNAMTYPDKTCYPVASCNNKDFENLMDVYMDAVLHPAIYQKEEIFRQEGWHYEIDSPEDDIVVNGVVYSEMKGLFSSPDERLERGTFNTLFPDNAYGVESGGDPAAIPTLTYEDFLDFHRKYYHPANSYISLVGDIDMEERLEWLDREYLSEYDEIEVDSAMKLQEPIGVINVEGTYPIADDDPEENSTYVNWSFMLANGDDLDTNAALGVVCQVLFDMIGAPVKEALIKAGIGDDVSFSLTDEICQPFGSLIIKNTEENKLPLIKKIIKEKLEEAVHDGLNRRSLLSAINKAEFLFNEEDFGTTPKSLIYILRSLDTWLYDDDAVFAALSRRGSFDLLRARMEGSYYEDLVRDYLLNGESQSYYVLKPEKGKQRREDEKQKKAMKAFKESLSGDEIEELVRRTKALREYQEEPSTPEDLLTIPLLERKDISEDGTDPINETRNMGAIPVIFHNIDTNGIIYFDLMFDLNGIEADDAKYLGLAMKLFGSLNTSEHSYLELDNETGIHTGGIGIRTTTYSNGKSKDYRPMIMMSGKSLEREKENLLKLMFEELLDTDFSSTERIREVIKENVAGMKSSFVYSGHRCAIAEAKAALSNNDAFISAADGHNQYVFLRDLADAPDSEIMKAVERIKNILAKALTKENLTLNITTTDDIYGKFEGEALAMIDRLASSGKERSVAKGPEYRLGARKIAYKTAGDVNFVGMSGIVNADSPELVGRLMLASSLLSVGYLWNNVRVLGGAYGCGFNYVRSTAGAAFYSYRDPQLGRTIGIYSSIAGFLRDFSVDEREMTKFIIGTIGNIDTPLTPDLLGRFSLNAYMTGIDAAWLKARRNAVLKAQQQDMRELAPVFDEIDKTGNICVVGSETAIEAEKELFDTIENLL